MARIPQTFIDELLARTDIVQVVEEVVPLRKSGKSFSARCPFHTEKTPSFSVSQEKQLFHCFGCGASGSAIRFVMDYAKLGFVEAVHQLATRVGLKVPEEGGKSDEHRVRLNEIWERLERASRYFQQQLRTPGVGDRAIEYLRGRGLDGSVAKTFALGYAPAGWNGLCKALGTSPNELDLLERAGLVVAKEKGARYYDRFRDRVMFPILDHQGRCVGFGGRVLGKEQPKYLNSPETEVFHKGAELYGLYQARSATTNLTRLLVVEGYMDVIALVQKGITGVVATLGTATTPEHLKRLFRHVNNVVFCFDGDAAGKRAAWRALETGLAELRDGREVGFIFLPSGEDPDTLVRTQGVDALLDATNVVPLSEFLISSLGNGQATIEGRARIANIARPLLSSMPQGATKELLTRKIADIVGVSDLGSLSVDTAKRPPSPSVRESASGGRRLEMKTLVRRALTLILHYPQLALKADPEASWLSGLRVEGMSLLAELIVSVHRQPTITSGGLLEQYRGHVADSEMQKLLAAPMLLGDRDIDSLAAAGLELDAALLSFEKRLSKEEARRNLIAEVQKRLEKS